MYHSVALAWNYNICWNEKLQLLFMPQYVNATKTLSHVDLDALVRVVRIHMVFGYQAQKVQKE